MKSREKSSEIRAPRIRPPLKWAGGKSGLLSQIIPLFPQKFNRYFEPFFGGGAIFFSLDFKGKSFLNDSNKELVELYEVIRDDPQGLMVELNRLRHLYSETFYYELRRTTPSVALERAARTLFLNKTGFNGLYRQNSKGEFNVPFGKRLKCPSLYERENLLRTSQALTKSQLVCADFEIVLKKAGEGDLVYCDPPYEPLSKTSSFNAYQGVGFTQADQQRLKSSCLSARERGATVFISNSASDFIHELYADCRVHIVSARRAINSVARSRGPINEVLIELSAQEPPR